MFNVPVLVCAQIITNCKPKQRSGAYKIAPPDQDVIVFDCFISPGKVIDSYLNIYLWHSKRRPKRVHILLQDPNSECSAIYILPAWSFILGDLEANPQKQNESNSIQGQLAINSLSDCLYSAAFYY